MKRLTLVIGLMALLTVPAVVAAQDYPMGGGGGIQVGGGMAGGDDDGGAGESGVMIVDFAFQPSTSFVPLGTTVEWSNEGAAPHTVTANSGAFDSGTVGSGGSFGHSFDAAGIYAYHCAFHPSMHGTVIVTG